MNDDVTSGEYAGIFQVFIEWPFLIQTWQISQMYKKSRLGLQMPIQ